MKKNLLIFCIILLSLTGILKIQKFLQKQYFLSKLKGKYFITIAYEKIKDPDKRKNKIMGYDGKKKTGYANTEKIESILSYEDGKIFYYKEFNTSEWEIVEYALKTKKIRKILEYNGEGLPLITKERIYYSKGSKIYILDKNTEEIKYLCEGIKPFAYDNGYLYYMDTQNNLIKISEKNNQKEKLYTLESNMKIGGNPEKITNDLYLFVKLVPKFIKVEFDVDDT